MAAAVAAVDPPVGPPADTTVAPVTVEAARRPLSDPLVARGQVLVRERCAGCHSVQPRGTSIYAHAPPFRWLKDLAPGVLQRVAAEIAAGDHAAMPSVVLTPAESEAIAAFIRAYAKADAKMQKTMSVAPCVGRRC